MTDVAHHRLHVGLVADAPNLALVVWGKPGTAGSKRGFPIYRKGPNGAKVFTGRIAMVDDAARRPDSPGATWRQAVIAAARAEIACSCPDPECTRLQDGYPITGPVELSAVFTWPRPGTLKPGSMGRPITKPDVLKLMRGTEDALTDAKVWADDAQVRYRRLDKVYPDADPMALPAPGVVIYLWRARPLTAIAEPRAGQLPLEV